MRFKPLDAQTRPNLRLRIGFSDPDALLLTGLRNFSIANDNGDGDVTTHLAADAPVSLIRPAI